jgi:hypothetical protein
MKFTPFTFLLFFTFFEVSYSQSFGQTACQLSPCENNGACTDVTGTTRSCLCMVGYGGADCQYDTNACQPEPCQNDGSCSSSLIMKPYVEFTIEISEEYCWNRQLVTGWAGGTKEQCYEAVKLNKDAVGGCNGRTFIYRADSESCACGTDMCDSRQDMAYGWTTYMQESLEEESTCTCPQYFTGQNCETALPTPCTNNPCQNSGVCNLDGSGYTCDCPTGYDGFVCQFDIDACDPDPCQNTATCTSVIPQGSNVATHTCDCPTGYTGTNCEEDINECDPDPCQNGATCTEGIGEYTCDCPTGYTGTNCEEDINECDPDPCQNSATCTEGIGEYTCDCPTGYTGTNCEEDVSENFCNPNPCLYNSVCTQVNGTHICECPPGHAGPHCELNVAIGCDSVPCQHGGTCSNGGGADYTCNCSITGYNGTNCEIEVDDDLCDPNPCFGQANRCIQDKGTYICSCPPHTGINCELHTEDANTENTATNVILICLLIILVIIISWSCGLLCCGGASAAVISVKKLEKEQLLNTIEIIF